MSAPAKPLASLLANPRLAQWLSIHADGTVRVRSGKVELGQGIRTALAQIVAHELDVDLSRIHMQPAISSESPNEGVTAGSMSVADSGGALRQVCAEARAIYLAQAARQLGLPPEAAARLQVRDGRIGLPDATAHTSYWALADAGLLDVPASGQALPKPAQERMPQARRLDIAAKVLGQSSFIHDIELPGMLHGAVLQAPSPQAQLRSVDTAPVAALPGVQAVVRDGSFLGLVADSEHAALQALAKLRAAAVWDEPQSLPDMHDVPAHLRAGPQDSTVAGQKEAQAPLQPTAFAHQASYDRPFLAHASIAPSCAIACHRPEDGGRLEVWTHSQGIFNLRADLATLFQLPPERVVVQHADSAGSYGHNGADDVAADAALLARAVPGRPVRVQWSREDELGCAPFGAAMLAELSAEVDAQGRIQCWAHQVWSTGHSMRPGRSAIPVLRAANFIEGGPERQVAINMPMAGGGGAERNSLPSYDIPAWQAHSHRNLRMPIRTSSLRSLGAHLNVFASESFMDELAERAGIDPLDFRLQHLSDARGRAVLEKVAQMAGWARRPSGEGQGLGLGFARYKNTGAYCAVAARVDAGAELRVEKLWIAVDVGRVVSLDGVVNQIEGGAIQTVSWVTKEQVRFDRTRITTRSWEDYPILRFSEVPEVEVELLDRPELPSLGAGEATHGPVAAAIANAVHAALGVRMRRMPINAETIAHTALSP